MSGDKWGIKAEVVELELAEPFTIATKTWTTSTIVFVRVVHDRVEGIGEVAPDDRFGDSPADVAAGIERVDLNRLASPFDLEAIAELLPASSARCALDIALHDLAARLAGISLAELLGVGGRSAPLTSVTVPIAEPDRMIERARFLADHPVLKVKVGFDGDVDFVRRLRSVYDGAIRIDANEGWEPDEAIERLAELEGCGIELCEQPIARGQHEELMRVTKATSIPVFADEDVCTATDVARLAGVVDGVNLKLRKSGGIRAVVQAIGVARANHLGVMLGCDLTSGVAATAEATVATMVDHADIDGPLLLARDPHPGVMYDRGRMTLPPGPGLGVEPGAPQ